MGCKNCKDGCASCFDEHFSFKTIMRGLSLPGTAAISMATGAFVAEYTLKVLAFLNVIAEENENSEWATHFVLWSSALIVGVQTFTSIWDGFSYFGQGIDNFFNKLRGKPYFLNEVADALEINENLARELSLAIQRHELGIVSLSKSKNKKKKDFIEETNAPGIGPIKGMYALILAGWVKMSYLLNENDAYDNINKERKERLQNRVDSLTEKITSYSKFLSKSMDMQELNNLTKILIEQPGEKETEIALSQIKKMLLDNPNPEIVEDKAKSKKNNKRDKTIDKATRNLFFFKRKKQKEKSSKALSETDPLLINADNAQEESSRLTQNV